MQAIKQSFKKGERLKSQKLIGNLFETGKAVNQFPFKLIYDLSDSSDFDFPAKIAVSVSKKSFKKAVDRNRIKRRIKEAYRKNKHILYEELAASDQKVYFIVIYIAKEDLDYENIEGNLKTLIAKTIKKIKTNN